MAAGTHTTKKEDAYMPIKDLKGEADSSKPAVRRAPQGTRLGGTEAPVVLATPVAQLVSKACSGCMTVLPVPQDAKFCPTCGGLLLAPATTVAQVASETAAATPAPQSFTLRVEVQQPQPAPVVVPAPAVPDQPLETRPHAPVKKRPVQSTVMDVIRGYEGEASKDVWERRLLFGALALAIVGVVLYFVLR